MRKQIEKIENQNSKPQLFAVAYIKGSALATFNVGVKSEASEDAENYPEGEIYSCTQVNVNAEKLSLAECIDIVNEYSDGITPTEVKEIATALGYGINDDDTLETAKRKVVSIIEAFDTSSSVNSFTLSGNVMWLSLEKRKDMRQSLTALKAMGVETFTYWLGTTPITMPVEQFEAMLNAVEVYAIQCYNVTAQHKASIEALTDIAEVEAYDYTSGYPDKLSF